MFIRHVSPIDRLLIEIERALGATAGGVTEASEPSPALDIPEADLNSADRRNAAGLMRVNHTGEVCAQALYAGQAAVARDSETRAQLLQAAAEESDHLVWCAQRLNKLSSRPSLLNPLWYAGSFVLGATAALGGDGLSLGFVVETERQVEAHLGEHLEKLPAADAASRAVVERMQSDEARHGAMAQASGAIALPFPIPRLMQAASTVMKAVAYRV